MEKQGATKGCDDFHADVLTNKVEYKKQNSYEISAVKCHLKYAFISLKNYVFWLISLALSKFL